jgi:hypothetical protein
MRSVSELYRVIVSLGLVIVGIKTAIFGDMAEGSTSLVKELQIIQGL